MAEPVPASAAGLVDGRDQLLDPASVQAARIVGGVWAAVLSGAGLIGALSILFSTGVRGFLALSILAAWAGLVVLLTAASIGWPALRYRYTSYRVDAQGLRIRRGVLWRSETSVPRSRVQHTDVSRGPVERSFGLATLIVHTAGTENASITLGGLADTRAREIRDYLIVSGDDDAV